MRHTSLRLLVGGWMIATLSLIAVGGLAQEAPVAEPAAQEQDQTDEERQVANPAAGGYGEYGMEGGYPGQSGNRNRHSFLLREAVTGHKGEQRWTPLSATRHLQFTYPLDSLKPQKVQGAYGGGDYGDSYGGEGGYDGGYGGAGGYGGSYGGEGGYGGSYGGGGYGGGYGGEGAGYGAMGGSPGGPGAGQSGQVITIHAYVFDDELQKGRARIELAVEPHMGVRSRPSAGAVGADGGYGADMSGYGEGDGYGMGAGGGGMPQQRLLPLRMLVSDGAGAPPRAPLSETEFQIVSDTIRQQIWKENVVRRINRTKEFAELEAQEQILKRLLTEEYETQVARQEYEIDRIENRVQELRSELSRRREAKERVIDVQLGNIILEAQGLLDR